MFQTVVATVSLKKPVCLAKIEHQTGPLANPVCTVSLARRPTVSLAKVLPTVSLAKRPTSVGTATEALLAFFGSQDELHRALGRTDADAARDIAMSCIEMEIAAGDYERLSGRQLNTRAAIHAAFGSQDINRGTWRMDGGKIVTFKEAMERVMRAA
ncbi:hypothetical protein BJF92_13655 [Rhizobium rhizosphaerae]|uniref:Uncharacterized protein n=1 Tax=Xaviernesmea rhizosphaerae TaxID=1672749 RepID=A0A1Q9AI74_9HYPH|nr:hypothetical protein [Xaviernesmea rhizosphaerae]OLP54850.1 hypothetical protein BJF92_13655 [Xaviernesmea rhizosphaerae]